MKLATPKQLKERWLTPQGKKVRQQIIDHIQEDNWERFLEEFPFVEEIGNRRDLRFVNLFKADLKRANFWRADLRGAHFEGTDLRQAHFVRANLRKTHFGGADLKGSTLWGADLRGAHFGGTNLAGTILRRANLGETDLKESILLYCQLIGTDLSGADLTNAYIYGISTWDIKINKKTKMKNLIISKDPLITVDDIEIAQFIYMISNNKKIRNIIDSMRTKGVLILGSFDDKTKPILNKLTEILSENNLIPMIFYFKKPKNLTLMDTVKTMALLSRFVIIDLSVRSGQLYEVGKLVDNIKVPYATIAFEGTKVSAMLSELNNFYWYRENYFPYPKKEWEKRLPILIKNEIIPWADDKNEELHKKNMR